MNWRTKVMLAVLSSALMIPTLAMAESTATALEQFADRYEKDCHQEHARMVKDLSAKQKLTEEQKVNSDGLEKAKCQCMAGYIKNVTDPKLARDILDENERAVAPYYSDAYRHCLAQNARDTAEPLCMVDLKKPPGTANAAAICKCVGDAFAKLDDNALIEESIAAFKNTEARAKDPSVAPFKGKLDEIHQTCGVKPPK